MGQRTDWGGLIEPAAVQPLNTRQLLTPDWEVEKFRGRILPTKLAHQDETKLESALAAAKK